MIRGRSEKVEKKEKFEREGRVGGKEEKFGRGGASGWKRGKFGGGTNS